MSSFDSCFYDNRFGPNSFDMFFLLWAFVNFFYAHVHLSRRASIEKQERTIFLSISILSTTFN